MSGDYASKLKQIDELINLVSVQEILTKAFEITGHPALTHSMEYKLLDYAKGVECADPIWNEYTLTGTVSKDTIDFFQKENFIDIAANTNTTAFLGSEKLPYDRLFAKLFVNDTIQVGCMAMVACFKSFTEEDYELFESLRQVICKKISDKPSYTAYGIEYQKSLISTLIEGTYGDKKLFSPHLTNLYKGLGSKIHVAIIDISECDKSFNNTDEYITHLKSVNNTFKYFIYGKYIVVILSADTDGQHNENVITFNKVFAKDNVFTGVSESFENLFEIKEHFQQAKQALEHGKSLGNIRIFN